MTVTRTIFIPTRLQSRLHAGHSLVLDDLSRYSWARLLSLFLFFFFNDTATTEIYTLSLHDALPIFGAGSAKFDQTLLRADLFQNPRGVSSCVGVAVSQKLDHFILRNRAHRLQPRNHRLDRKSTRLNSSHDQISYAVFCLKKKKQHKNLTHSFRHNACNEKMIAEYRIAQTSNTVQRTRRAVNHSAQLTSHVLALYVTLHS